MRKSIPFGIGLPHEEISIYKSHSLDGDIQGTEGEVEVGCMGLSTPNPTLPLNLHVPQSKAEATSHSASKGTKRQVGKIKPKKKSSIQVQDQDTKDKSYKKGHW